MRINSKGLTILSIFASLTLIFLLAIDVVSAYFTSRSSANGDFTFGKIEVNYSYRTTSGGAIIPVAGNELNLAPDNAQIKRGDTFSFKLLEENGSTTETVDSLQFTSSADSSSAYIRFMLDAYIVNSAGEVISDVNYGQYFLIEYGPAYVTHKLVENNGVTNTVYYLTRALPSDTTYIFANRLTLLNSAPLEMLNTDIQITITYKAVQTSNEAYKYVFNDGWGYLDEEFWT